MCIRDSLSKAKALCNRLPGRARRRSPRRRGLDLAEAKAGRRRPSCRRALPFLRRARGRGAPGLPMPGPVRGLGPRPGSLEAWQASAPSARAQGHRAQALDAHPTGRAQGGGPAVPARLVGRPQMP
eukprot:8958849-Alexandrium_andersonii.AAC.1